MCKDSLGIFEAVQYILKAKKNIIISSEQFAKATEEIKKLYRPYQIKSYTVESLVFCLLILTIFRFTPDEGETWAVYLGGIFAILFFIYFVLTKKFFEPKPRIIENALDPVSQNIFNFLGMLTDLISNEKITCKVRLTDKKPKKIATRLFARDFGILALIQNKSESYYLSKSEIDDFLHIDENTKTRDMSRTSNPNLRFGHIVQHLRGQDLEDLLELSRQYAETKKLFAIDILEIACRSALTCITNEEIALTIQDKHNDLYLKGRFKDVSDLTVELGCNANTPRSWHKEIHFPQHLSQTINDIIMIENGKKRAPKKGY